MALFDRVIIHAEFAAAVIADLCQAHANRKPNSEFRNLKSEMILVPSCSHSICFLATRVQIIIYFRTV